MSGMVISGFEWTGLGIKKHLVRGYREVSKNVKPEDGMECVVG